MNSIQGDRSSKSVNKKLLVKARSLRLSLFSARVQLLAGSLVLLMSLEFSSMLAQTEQRKRMSNSPDLLGAGNVQNGKKTYTRDGCYECHGNHAEGSSATGPRLTPLPVALDAFVDYIRHPTGQMPPYSSKVVPSSDLADIYSFLQSLPKPPNPDFIPLLSRCQEQSRKDCLSRSAIHATPAVSQRQQKSENANETRGLVK